MTAAEWIAKRRELLDAATEGPWRPEPRLEFDADGSYELALVLAEDDVDPERYVRGIVHAGILPEDATLIADARTSLPLALDALEAALELAKGHRAFVTKRGRDDCICTICDMCRAIETALRAES